MRRRAGLFWDRRLMLVLLALIMLCLGLAACAPGDGAARSPSVPTATATTIADPSSHIHNVSQGDFVLFARITFVPGVTYDEAVALLRGHVYPWTCDDPRSSTPPPADQQRASFTVTHALLVSYPTWDELTRLAASPQVVSVDGVALYQCT